LIRSAFGKPPGHCIARSSTTSDIYIHVDDEEARRAAHALAEAVVPDFAQEKPAEKELVN